MKKNRMIFYKIIQLVLAIVILFSIDINGEAKEGESKDNEGIEGYYIELSEKSDYSTEKNDTRDTFLDGKQLGDISISGSFKKIDDVNGFPSYEIKEDNIEFMYKLQNNYTNISSGSWYITSDKEKKVDGIDMGDKIGKGGLIIQSSLDGTNWTTIDKKTDLVNIDLNNELYTTKDIQQVNGCYFRIIIAYKLQKQLADKKVLFVNVDNYEYKRVIELYEFYLINSSENKSNAVSPDDTPKKELGSKTKKKKDNGFSGSEIIDSKDPHYGWDIGTFFVNGYTQEMKNDENDPVFLKKVGDKVTLWFSLKQDIKKLNEKDNLSIASDKNASDKYFETAVTNFKRGTLIIRFTDFEGKKHDPIIYTDYLAACASTTAETRVELFEEGDYEVALDYEIKDDKGVDSYSDYQIFFKFSVRNGNSMVFPFDVKTESELRNKDITENGFKIDLAKSKYLKINVKRTAIIRSGKTIKEDVRYDAPAKDGEEYIDDGEYTITVKNTYTGEENTKIIYVGSDNVLKALSKNNLSASELEVKLKQGYVISEDGGLSVP